jgi:hypothetical protein
VGFGSMIGEFDEAAWSADARALVDRTSRVISLWPALPA